MDFTRYTNRVCNDIEKNEVLKKFFERLSIDSSSLLELKIKDQIIINSIEEPSLDTILEIVTKLRETNIEIDCNDNMIKAHSYIHLFEEYMFRPYSILIEDVEFIRKRIETSFDACSKISPAEQEYLLWLDNNKDLVRKLEKIEKRGVDIRKKENYLLWGEIFKRREGNRLKRRVEFIKKLTIEQMQLIVELYDNMVEYHERCLHNKERLTEIDKHINETKELIYEEAFKNTLDNSLDRMDIDSVIKILFKILIIDKLESDETTVEKLSFDTEIVDWFIRYKNNELTELYGKIFNNFDLVIQEKYQKSKTLGGNI